MPLAASQYGRRSHSGVPMVRWARRLVWSPAEADGLGPRRRSAMPRPGRIMVREEVRALRRTVLTG